MGFDYRNLGLATPSGRITIWAYSTVIDDIVDVCKTGYFQQGEMRLGDRIEVSAKGEVQATLAVIGPGKDGRIKTRPLACYPPSALDRLPTKQRPARIEEVEEPPAEAAA